MAANTNLDLQRDCAPYVNIHKRYGKEVTVKYHPNAHTDACSLTRQMTIQAGTTRRHKQISPLHYAPPTPTPKKCFASTQKNLGVIVTQPPPMFLDAKILARQLAATHLDVAAICRVVSIQIPQHKLGRKLVHDTLLRGTPHRGGCGYGEV
jgi:hypothetical protein